MAAVEGLPERLEASRGRLEGFVKGVTGDAAQYTMGLVKSHFAKADLDLVGDSVPPDCSDEDWEANPLASVGRHPILSTKRVWSVWTAVKNVLFM